MPGFCEIPARYTGHIVIMIGAIDIETYFKTIIVFKLVVIVNSDCIARYRLGLIHAVVVIPNVAAQLSENTKWLKNPIINVCLGFQFIVPAQVAQIVRIEFI